MATESSTRRVLVVGGGVGGLATAIALRHRGIESEVVELHARPPIVGVGLTLLGPTLRALSMLGLLDVTVARGWGMDELLFCDASGTVFDTVEIPRRNGPDYPGQVGCSAPSSMRSSPTPRRPPARRSDEHHRHRAPTGTRGGSGELQRRNAEPLRPRGRRRRHPVPVRRMTFTDAPEPEFRGQAVWRAVLDRPPELTRYTCSTESSTKAGIDLVSQTKLYVLLVQNVPDATRPDQQRLPEILARCWPSTAVRSPNSCRRSVIPKPSTTGPWRPSSSPVPGTGDGL